ncbi:MAG: hypothetical protein ACRD40_10295 [Candidatus Acidiferrales bacterium]
MEKIVLTKSRQITVDKQFLAVLPKERESIAAVLEFLTDRTLTDRLLNLSDTIDQDVAEGRLLTSAGVFGE